MGLLYLLHKTSDPLNAMLIPVNAQCICDAVLLSGIQYSSDYCTEYGKYEGESNENFKYILFIIMDDMVC